MDAFLVLVALLSSGCGGGASSSGDSGGAGGDGGAIPDDGGTTDGGLGDGGRNDGGSSDGGAGDGGSSDGGAGDGGSSDGGAGDGGSDHTSACPSGMVPVPADDPGYCIDAYEASIEDGLPVSVAGVMPAKGVSFDEARELCASVHAVTAEGEDLGPMWLATLPQWTDAADGVVGDGGSSYPYGDTWRDAACATPTADGGVVLESEVETGSFPECVSAFGVYDQVGNVWEWADPEIDVDAGGWLDARAAEGREFAFTHEGWMQLVHGTVDGLTLQVAGLTEPFPTVDGDGYILVSHDDLQFDDPDFAFQGFFTPEDLGEARGDDFLPVQVDLTTDFDGFYPVVFLPEEDGEPITAKVGCAWYTGDEIGCRLTSVVWFHPHDFDGSISFRCASPPLR